jgi:ribonuclease-3
MDFAKLEDSLGITFRDKKLLQQALTHRSFLNENRDWPVGTNERLEFLGDSVIQLTVSTLIFDQFPDKPEGELTPLRGKLVSAATLAEIGKELNLYEKLWMSRGEHKDTNERKYIRLTCCAFEAVVGAIYLDQGYAAAVEFVRPLFLNRIQDPSNQKRDAKSMLQEKAQGLQITPTYELIQRHGLDHDVHFVVGVYLGTTLIARGRGPSKKLAEEDAAQQALVLKGWDEESAA